VIHLGEIVERLKRKKVSLRILNLGVDSSTATGKLVLNVMGSIAAFEREMMLERQREGIAKARAAGKYRGRPPSIDVAKVQRRKAEGARPSEIAKQLNIARASVYRALAAKPTKPASRIAAPKPAQPRVRLAR
jgi:DNA invertase Pin-like site-specific DNA recombinase